MINNLPIDLQKYLFKEFLGERVSLSTLKCVSKKFNYISYHKSNHIKCSECEWFIKNFPRNHNCNTPNCMLIKYLNPKKKIKMGTHFRGCRFGYSIK